MLTDVDIASIESLELGLNKQVSTPMETMHVGIGEANQFDLFAEGWVAHAHRVNPLKAEQVGLEAKDLSNLLRFYANARKQISLNKMKGKGKFRVFTAPTFAGKGINSFGKVVFRNVGITVNPGSTPECDLTFEKAKEISDLVLEFETDLQVSYGFMNLGEFGNEVVMSQAIIAGFARSLFELKHPNYQIYADFMGLTLEDEAFEKLYRRRGDDQDYITMAAFHGKGIFE